MQFSIPDLKDRFSPVPIYIAGIHGLGNTVAVDRRRVVGWPRGNELVSVYPVVESDAPSMDVHHHARRDI